jgi:hypothetical protein
MGKVTRSQDRTTSDGSDNELLAPPLPVLDRPVAVALLDLLRRATAVEQSEPPVERDDEAVRS